MSGRLRSLPAVGLLAAVLVATACGGASPSDRSGTGSSSGSGATIPSCANTPPDQTVSEPCCASYGVDACGAGLFCAAFDGRKYPTCYPLHSRQSLEACTADDQCALGSCNTATGFCRSSAYEPCTAATGCVQPDQHCVSACPDMSGHVDCSSSLCDTSTCVDECLLSQ